MLVLKRNANTKLNLNQGPQICLEGSEKQHWITCVGYISGFRVILTTHQTSRGMRFMGKENPKEKQRCPGSSCSSGLINGLPLMWLASSKSTNPLQAALCRALPATVALSARGNMHAKPYLSWMHKVTATGIARHQRSSSSSHLVLFTHRYSWLGYLWWTACCSFTADKV